MPSKPANIPVGEVITLRLGDATKVTGLSRSKLYELMAAGELASTKIGGRRLLFSEDLRALLEAGKRR